MPAHQLDARSPRRDARRGGLWLALVALIGLHPLAMAGEAGSRGLAALLQQLVCGCPSCEGEAPVVQIERSCCQEAEPIPDTGDGCEASGACTCAHPDSVPVPDRGALAADGSRALAEEASIGLRTAQEVAARTPISPALRPAGPGEAALAGCPNASAQQRGVARDGPLHADTERETRERLALHGTALI